MNKSLLWIPAGVMLMRRLRFGRRMVLGFGTLVLVNTASAYTGLRIPVNAVTVAAAGYLGLPGLILLAMLG